MTALKLGERKASLSADDEGLRVGVLITFRRMDATGQPRQLADFEHSFERHQ